MNGPAPRSRLQTHSIGSGSELTLASLGISLSGQRDGTEAVQVACDHGQRDVALEAVDTVVGAAV